MHEDIIRQYAEARKRLRINQDEVGDIIGTKKYTISRMENLKHVPSLEMFAKCVDAIGMMVAIVPKPEGMREEKRIKNKYTPTMEKVEINYDNFYIGEEEEDSL